jgi:hypothetical protein
MARLFIYGQKPTLIIRINFSLVIDNHLPSLQELIILFSRELIELADYAASNQDKENRKSIICSCLGISELPAANQTDIERWQALAELLLTNKGRLEKQLIKPMASQLLTKSRQKESKRLQNSKKK